MGEEQGADSRDRGGWEEHSLAQLARALEATPAQRLAWLEEAIRFAFRAGALPREPDGPEAAPASGDPATS